MAGSIFQALATRHVMMCRLTQETWVYNVEDDVAGNIWQALPAAGREPHGALRHEVA